MKAEPDPPVGARISGVAAFFVSANRAGRRCRSQRFAAPWTLAHRDRWTADRPCGHT